VQTRLSNFLEPDEQAWLKQECTLFDWTVVEQNLNWLSVKFTWHNQCQFC
jgi:hypothetical protein